MSLQDMTTGRMRTLESALFSSYRLCRNSIIARRSEEEKEVSKLSYSSASLYSSFMIDNDNDDNDNYNDNDDSNNPFSTPYK